MLGCTPSIFKKYFQPMKDRGVEEPGKELAALTPDELKVIKEAATVSVKEVAQGEWRVVV